MSNLWQTICLNSTKKYISQTVLEYIEKLLLEKNPLAGIARVMVFPKVASGLCQRFVCPSSQIKCL